MLMKIWRLSWWSALLLLLLFVFGVYFVVSTDSGSRWSVKTISALTPGLIVSNPKGNWLNGIHAEKLSFKFSSGKVIAEKFYLQWNLRDLILGEVTLNNLTVATLRLNFPEKKKKQQVEKESEQALTDIASGLSMPFHFQIRELQINKTLVNTYPNDWEINQINGVIKYHQQQWLLSASNTQINAQIAGKSSLSMQLNNAQATLMTQSPYTMVGNLDLNLKHRQLNSDTHLNTSLQAQWQGPLSKFSLNINSDSTITGQGDRLSAVLGLNGYCDFSQIEPRFDLSFATTGATSWQKNDLSLHIQDVLLTLKGSVSQYELHGSWQALLDDQLLMSKAPIQGQFQAMGNKQGLTVEELRVKQNNQRLAYEGQINWLNGPLVDGNVLVHSLDLTPWLKKQFPSKKNAQANITGEIKVRVDSKGTGKQLEISSDNIQGTWLGQPLEIKGGLQWQPQFTEFKNVLMRIGQNYLSLAGKANQSWNVGVKINFPVVDQLWPAINGQIQADIDISGHRAHPVVRFNSSSPRINYQGWTLLQSQLSGNIRPLAPGPLAVELTSAVVTGPNFRTENSALFLSGSEAAHKLDFSTQGAFSIYAQLEGSWSRKAGHWQGMWQDFTVKQSNDKALSLIGVSNTTLDFSPFQIEQSLFCLTDSKQKLCLRGSGSLQKASAITEFHNFDLSWLNLWLQGALLTGNLDLQQEIYWQPEKITLEGRGQLNKFTMPQWDHQPLGKIPKIDNLDFSYDLRNTHWQLLLKGQSNPGGLIDVTAEGDLTIPYPIQANLNLKQLDLAPWQALAPFIQGFGGALSAELQVAKTSEDGLSIIGKSQLQQGFLILGASPLEQFQNINLQVDFEKHNARLIFEFDGLNKQHWASQSPWQLIWAPYLETWALNHACLVSGESDQICTQVQRQPQSGVHVNVDASGNSNSLLSGYLPDELSIDGKLSTSLTFAYKDYLSADLNIFAEKNQLTLTQADMPEQILPIDRFLGKGSLKSGLINVTAELQGRGLGDGSIAFTLPLSQLSNKDSELKHNMMITEGLKAEVNLSEFQLAVLKPFIPAVNALDGSLSAQGTLVSKNKQALFNGTARLNDGKFTSELLPVSSDKLNMTLVIVDNEATLNGMMNSGKGQIILTGTGVTNLPDWQAQLNLQGHSIPLIKAPEVDLLINPDMSLDLSPQQLLISGDIYVKEGYVTLEKLPGGSISVSPDTVLMDQQQTIALEKQALNLDLDLIVHLEELVKLRGPGVEGRLSGQVHLTQVENSIRTLGYLDVVEGRYFGLGPRLTVRQGRIDFRGPLEDPILFIEAVRIIEDVTAGLRIEGSVESPQMTLFSEPAMPDDKILVYLLTGKPPSNEPLDMQNLANQALLSLSIAGGEGYAQSIAEKFGFRDLEISAGSGEDGSSVNIGGYLSPKIYVEYGRSLFSPVNTFTVRYRIRKGLFLEAISGLENALDILYSFEF